ncbi:LOW QUALITY PROTEIN: hypothetical protein SSJG_02716, partial [Escherichia coli D9]
FAFSGHDRPLPCHTSCVKNTTSQCGGSHKHSCCGIVINNFFA